MMHLTIRGIEGDLGPVYSDTFRRDMHNLALDATAASGLPDRT